MPAMRRMQGCRKSFLRLRFRVLRGFHKPRGISRHRIDFEVQRIADLTVAPGRDRKRVLNDEHVEHVPIYPVDGKRRPVERDRAFRRDEPRELRRRFEHEPHCLALFLPLADDRLPVHMAGNNVTAKLIADLQGTLKIDTRSCRPGSSSGETQRLFPRLDLEPAIIRTGLGQGHDSKANARARNRSADGDGCGIIGCADPEANALVQRMDVLNPADVRDDAREHQRSFTYSKYSSSPKRSRRTSRKPSGRASGVTGATTDSAPSSSGETKRQSLSTRSSSRNALAVCAPPSTNSVESPLAARSSTSSGSATSPSAVSTARNCTRTSGDASRRSAGQSAAVVRKSGTVRAEDTSVEINGRRRFLSSTMRAGERSCRP